MREISKTIERRISKEMGKLYDQSIVLFFGFLQFLASFWKYNLKLGLWYFLDALGKKHRK